MPKVISVGTSTPPYCFNQAVVKQFIHKLFAESVSEIDRLINVFDNSNISTRHFCVPLEWLSEQHSFSDRNELYKRNALKFSIEAINECLSRINARYHVIDHIIFVSSTGLSTPTIDALLLNKLKLNRHLERTPIWGLGCAGGAVGLTRALEFTRAYPKKNALLVAVELCSLTFQKDDDSKSNVVASSLFSDGAAAVLISGDQSKLHENPGIELLDTLTTTYYDSLDVMGWEINDEGFKVLFSRDIPSIVRECVEPNIQELLVRHNLRVDDLKYYITHPGGMKVINAYQESLGLTNGSLDYSRQILQEYGNMSSASVLYVMNEFLRNGKRKPGHFGLISALGPGFSSELILFTS
jgi:alkylresorcinol/alkylpyrone synthase